MRWVPTGLVAALLAVPAVPADPPPAARAATPEELVADLADPVFGTRERAQRELWRRGGDAVPALERAAAGDDPEAARRATEVLDRFAWGVRPDTPPDVLKLIREYRAGDPDPECADEVRQRAIADLIKKGPPGVAAVRAILKRNLPAGARAKLAATVTERVRHEVPARLVAGNLDEADELVALHLTGTTPEGAADCAAYHALRGDLPAAIDRAEAALAAGQKTDAARLVLVHL